MTSLSLAITRQLSLGASLGDVVAVTNVVAAAQRFGSALYTRYTHQPLKELINALNNDGDILAKRYKGGRIYDKEMGRYVTMDGEIKAMAMDEVVQREGEYPTSLSTVIVCLSVAISKEGLSPILASAIMLYVHGLMDNSMHGAIAVLQGKIEKYANAVLSRDGMCNKLQNAQMKVLRLIRTHAPNISSHAMFLPPLSPAKESDFAEFLVHIWSAQADNVEIYTRSIKLLGMALLLSEYGWQIDVFVETEDLVMIPIKSDIRALSVIYSLAPPAENQRTYVENHGRYVKNLRREFYPTASCSAANMGETSGLSIARTPADHRSFMKGYKIAQSYCDNFCFDVSLTPQGQTKMAIGGAYQASRRFIYEKSCDDLVGRLLTMAMPDSIQRLIVHALCDTYPKYDWDLMDEEIKKQLNPNSALITLLVRFEGNGDMLWTMTGAILGTIDTIIRSLINLADERLIRTPAATSLSKFINKSCDLLHQLLDNGLEPGLVVQLCATRLAGVNPENLRLASDTNNRNIIGYWNAQQGILVTPILERSLFYDLPTEKSRPFTLFNTPIDGMPTDDGGWIRPGTLREPAMRRIRNLNFSEPAPSTVVLENRPHFEIDGNSVVAAAYVDGVFYDLLPLDRTLSSYWHKISSCQHPETPLDSQVAYIDLQQLKSGEVWVPNDTETLLVSPQKDRASRLFSSILYNGSMPIIQKGCLSCAIKVSSLHPGSVVITNHKRRSESQ